MTDYSKEPQIINIYVAHGDPGDDRTPGIRAPKLGFFSEKYLAEQAAEGQGWWGGAGAVSEAFALKVNGKFYLLGQPGEIQIDMKTIDMVKKQALAKLTPEEKKVLGLS